MINDKNIIPPLYIPNIINLSHNPTPMKGNFIIPPLINNNPNYNLSNQTPTDEKAQDIKNQTSQQIPKFIIPPLISYNCSKPNPIPQINSNFSEDQFSSPQPPEENKSSTLVKSHVSTPIKAKWTKDEDNILRSAISKYGTNNWSLISKEIPGRTGKQCRERWLNQLSPNLNKEHWLPSEDSILAYYQAFYGNCWSKISHFLPGRSPNSVKNRWSFLMRHNSLLHCRIWI